MSKISFTTKQRLEIYKKALVALKGAIILGICPAIRQSLPAYKYTIENKQVPDVFPEFGLFRPRKRTNGHNAWFIHYRTVNKHIVPDSILEHTGQCMVAREIVLAFCIAMYEEELSC